MHLEYTPEQQELRAKIRAELESIMTPERSAAVSRRAEGGPGIKDCVRALAAANLLGVGWPKEYGGQGFSAIEQHIFFEEAKRVNAPIPLVTLNTVGPTLVRFGTEQQKREFLPAILDGTVEFAIGYSEPGAGSDLAALRTMAVRDGDEYVINGQKMFTSGAGSADYVWLAARTDPKAHRHRGISLFIVPTSAPGFSHRPLHTMPGVSTFYTFYDDVRVPASALVGAENEGWKLITTQLNFERAALGTLGALEPLLEKTIAWASDTMLDGARVIDQPWVQLALARVEAQVAAYKLVNLRVNAAMSTGDLDMGEASAAKVFGTELTQKVAGELIEILDRHGARSGSEAPLRGALDVAVRTAVLNTFGGGANEIQRTIIAMAGLGMPREPRPAAV
ncbi:acyl-CoA dehydrogenase family protein [Mycolicibacterium hodleri]|uniref:Acyl-CoA dehydrogenase n=1 Tax=Mycolicibacterium hodleri TaxID=49897 RepID=A0A502E2L3_9MYCO|nr:acyl-CoA dehydrogenase family protein [Mycolicibacterium hodleri]TPG31777.1 acyl-CoA dehydrogenase [Mycolicibacterium hodleri]